MADLELKIDAAVLSPANFIKGVRHFWGALQDVANERTGDEPLEWGVQVRRGSNVVAFKPTSGPLEQVPYVEGMMSEGIDALEGGLALPMYFPESAVRHLHDLAGLVGTTAENDTVIHVLFGGQQKAITHKTVATAAALLAAARKDYGSVEGKLEVLSGRGGFRVVVYDALRDKPIRCYLKESQLEDALAAFKSRVAVYGTVRYRADGRPASVMVDRIETLPSPADGFQRLRGILTA